MKMKMSLITLALLLSACDDETSPNTAGTTSGIESGTEAGTESGTSSGTESGTESGTTSGTESGTTSGAESGAESGTTAGAEPPLMPEQLPLELGEPLEGAPSFEETLTEGQVRVGWVDEPSEAIKGRNAACRVGCLRIENHLVRFCLQGERNFSQFSNSGGNLIDAVRVSHPEEDALSEVFTSPDLGELELESIQIVRDGSEAPNGPAVIQVRGRAQGSRIITGYLPQLTPLPYPMVTEYHLWPNTNRLEIYTWIGGADQEGAPLGLNTKLSDFVSWADDAVRYTHRQRGNNASPRSAFYGAHGPHVSYRWRSLDAPALSALTIPQLPLIPIMAGQGLGSAGSVALFKRALEVGEGSISAAPHDTSLDATDPDGGLAVPRVPVQLSLSLAPLTEGAGLELTAEGEPTDPAHPLHSAQLLDQLNAELWTARAEGEGGPMTLMGQVRLNSEGVAPLIELPEGAYELRLPQWRGAPSERAHLFEVPAVEGEPSAPLQVSVSLARPALLEAEVSVEGWPQGELVGFKVRLSPEGEPSGRLSHTLPCLGRCSWLLSPGEWRADVTRGWHMSAARELITLSAGALTTLTPTLIEELPFEGWSGGEFHQHSGPSLDSEVSPRERVLTNIAEGVGFMVPSDHDVLTDYPALVERLGWGEHVAAPITGVEISPLSGHLGAYGLPYDVDHPTAAGGAVPTSVREADGTWRRRWVSELVEEARERGAELIQVNHPRDSTGYFDEVGYVAGAPIEELTSQHWTPNFDTIEIYNGSRDLCAVTRDWVGLLTQGLRVVGVGNSDSHDSSKPVGYPRNYLPTQAERATGITRQELVEAIRNGRVSVGGGAVLDLPEGPLLGDTLSGATHSLRVRARTPSFAQLTRLVALFNGAVVWERELSEPVEALVDFDELIELSFEEDGVLMFFAEGPALELVNPGSPTFAFTNPLWIDHDASGALELTPRTPPAFSTSFCAAE